MTFNIITVFPEIFDSYFNEGIIRRALKSERITINIINLRDFASDKHKTVDDTPYGGGAGMLMKVDILYKALQALNSQFPTCLPDRQASNFQKIHNDKIFQFPNKVILTSAKGKPWCQRLANEYKNLNDITIICGRYEGVDERILEYVDEEISIGDYVLTGGEIGAMVLVDSIARLLPDVLGNSESAADESHSVPGELEYPQYTRPEVFIDDEGRELKVPEVLLSGNHAEIEKWRKQNKRKADPKKS